MGGNFFNLYNMYNSVEKREVKRIKLFYAGIAFLFGTCTHLILILMWSEAVFWYQLTHIGAAGSPISNISGFYWGIISLEFLVSVTLIWLGIKEGRKK